MEVNEFTQKYFLPSGHAAATGWQLNNILSCLWNIVILY